MGRRPDRDPGPGGEPGPGPSLPGSRQAPVPRDAPEPVRDPRLEGFALGGEWDTCPPSAAMATAMEGASGPEWRCAGASRDEMVGLLRRWAALEAWAAAGRLGVLRALIRDDGQPLPGGGWHGDLPDGWTKSLTHEVASALAVSVPTAENMMWLAWDLQVRLPGIAGLLADGDLACAKARAVDDAFQLLGGEDAARAEAMILPELPGKNYGQVKRLAEQAAITVDPDSAARRREDAERNRCRVQMSREDSGAAALSGRDLPTDQTLAAHASVCARAQEYKNSRAFPEDTRMDQFRVAAYLDLLNGITADARVATGQIATVTESGSNADDSTGADCACRECDGSCLPPADEDDDEPGDSGEPGCDEPDGPGNGGPPGGPGDGAPPTGRATPATPPRLVDMVIPLATLLGLAARPGEGHGLGPLDPELCRQLAAAAVGSPWTRLCVTVTDPDGIAIGHGCARLALPARRDHPAYPTRTVPVGCGSPAVSLPARVNLTIPAARLSELEGDTSPPGQGSWSLTRASDPGPPGGYGTWTLVLPDGRNLTVNLGPVPTFTCDHRDESHAYQPNDTLRHLVQIRDGECTFPPCARHARESDFEHAVPYDKGGRTCACNAGARSRACHQVKQSPGWKVTQPRPGWHQWETPSGRTYTQGPKRYPT
jgi:hypothetical protein